MSSLTGNFVPLDHPLGRQISLRGGGGKSTLGQALAAKNGLAYIELDAINWLPGWREREKDDFREKTQEALDAADDGWIADGNYNSSLGDLVLRQADTVIWLDLPWRVIFRRIFRRSIMRAIDREPVCNGNIESWGHFFSRDSLWWYYIVHRRAIITRGERFLPKVPAGVPIIHMTSPRQLDAFYGIHNLTR